MSTPLYSLSVGGVPVSSTGDARLIELVLTDEVGFKSDSLSITFDDSDQAIEWPRRGVEIKVQLGLGQLVDMGVYVVDAVQSSGPPDVIRVSAKAASFVSGKAMQTRKCASYEGVSLSDLCKMMAARYGMIALVGSGAENVIFDHIDQRMESDLAFLNRAAQSAGYIVKPCMGKLLVDERFSGKSVSGKVLTPVVIDKSDVTNWTISEADKGSYGAVIAEYRDTKGGGVKEFVMGTGEPELRLPHVYASKQSAKRGAETKLRNLRKGQGSFVELTMPSDGTFFSGMPIVLTGFRRGVNGAYFVGRVTHHLRSGLTCNLTALRKYEEVE